MAKSDIKKNDIWIVLPAHNETTYLARVLKKVKKITSNIIVVDDGSVDKTSTVARGFTPPVFRHVVNLGKGAALKTGCDFAFNTCKAKAVVLMDSDDQHDVNDLAQFFKNLQNGAQIVLGERAMNSSMPLTRVIANRGASVLMYLLFGRYFPDIPSGYKGFTKTCYNTIRWDSSGYEVELEIAARLAKNKIPTKVVTIQTVYHDFDRGMSILDVFTMIDKIITWKVTL